MDKQELVKLFALATVAAPVLLLGASPASAKEVSGPLTRSVPNTGREDGAFGRHFFCWVPLTARMLLSRVPQATGARNSASPIGAFRGIGYSSMTGRGTIIGGLS